MKSLAVRSLAWIDMQGYYLSDEEKRRLTVPIKFAPGVCMVAALTLVVMGSGAGLLVLAGFALAGALLPRHPFDYAYGLLLARPLRTGPAPRNTPQRRFACALGAVLLAGSGALFVGGYGAAAWVVGLAFVVVAFVVTTTNWCLPSLIYNRLLVRIGLPTAEAE